MNLLFSLFVIIMLANSAFAFRGLAARTHTSSVVARNMGTIATGVEFDTVAREWRLKWTPDHDKKSLATVQQTLNKFGASLKKIDGVKGVQRVVCGGCLDFKVIVSLPAEKWGAWVRSYLYFLPYIPYYNICISVCVCVCVAVDHVTVCFMYMWVSFGWC